VTGDTLIDIVQVFFDIIYLGLFVFSAVCFVIHDVPFLLTCVLTEPRPCFRDASAIPVFQSIGGLFKNHQEKLSVAASSTR
jgi:hypothetical protein